MNGDMLNQPDLPIPGSTLRQQMLYCISHDLKTPMASIIGSLEVLERMKAKLSAEKHDALVQLALQEAYRLDNFITNILDMDKLESGLVTPKVETTNIHDVIHNSLIQMSAALQDCEVHTHADSENPTIATDPLLLGRVMCVLLDNAAKYRSAKPVITIHYGKSSGGSAYIKVQDNGPGISPDQIDSIFSKFTRFAKKDQQNAGTGLGLSIGRAIMTLLNGSLTATSAAGESTTMTVKFSPL